MKQIPLTQGKVALVDDADYDRFNRWKWCANKKRHNHWYAVRSIRCENGHERKLILMHREILGLKYGDGIETDHKDGNGLNNQRENLRTATHTQNMHNQRHGEGCTSRFKGVSWDRCTKKWCAQINVEGKQLHLGHFLSEIEAAKVYDKSAHQYFGEFARMNF